MSTNSMRVVQTAVLWNVLVFFAPAINANGQNALCDDILTTEVDPSTNETILRSKKNIIISQDGGKTGFAIFGIVMDSSITFSITTVGAGPCVELGDKVLFIFTDSSELELSHMATSNCDAKSLLYFSRQRNNFDQLKAIREKELGTLTVWTKEKFLT